MASSNLQYMFLRHYNMKIADCEIAIADDCPELSSTKFQNNQSERLQ
jgi:hypothetical protein